MRLPSSCGCDSALELLNDVSTWLKLARVALGVRTERAELTEHTALCRGHTSRTRSSAPRSAIASMPHAHASGRTGRHKSCEIAVRNSKVRIQGCVVASGCCSRRTAGCGARSLSTVGTLLRSPATAQRLLAFICQQAMTHAAPALARRTCAAQLHQRLWRNLL
jgi:hypothetical protein